MKSHFGSLRVLHYVFLGSLAVGCATSNPKSPRPVKTHGYSDPQVVIIYSSDLHGQIRPRTLGGYARLKTLISKERSEAGAKTDVLAITGGDALGKSALPCRRSFEKKCVPLLKDMGLDLAVLGNGEMKRSGAELNELADLSGIAWMSSNVGLVGLTPKWSPDWRYLGPKSGANLYFASWTVKPSEGEVNLKKAKYSFVQSPSESHWSHWKRRSEGASIIWLPHQMMQDDLSLLAKSCATPGIKTLALLKANDHLEREDLTQCAPLLEPGAFGHRVVRLVLRPSAETGEWKLVDHQFLEVDSSIPEDPALKASIDALYSELAPDAMDVLGTLKSPFSSEEFGQWVANSFRNSTKADVAIVNMGAVKEGLPQGPLARESMAMAYPYTDDLMGLDWKKSDLEASLCSASRRRLDSFADYGSQLVFSGVKLENPGQADCRLSGSKKAVLKVVLVSYLVNRSKNWLGKDLSSMAFKFGLNSEDAMNLEIKKHGIAL